MAKPLSPLPGSPGLADWLPLLGSICQVLASLGEDEEKPQRSAPKKAVAQSLPSGSERG